MAPPGNGEAPISHPNTSPPFVGALLDRWSHSRAFAGDRGGAEFARASAEHLFFTSFIANVGQHDLSISNTTKHVEDPGRWCALENMCQDDSLSIHPLMRSDAHSSLAAMYVRRAEPGKAVDHAGKALVLRLEHLGVLHLCTADGHFMLGLVFRMLGRLADAAREFKFARSIRAELLGAEHELVGDCDLSASVVHFNDQNVAKAYMHANSSWHIFVKAYGHRHARTLVSRELVHLYQRRLPGSPHTILDFCALFDALVRMVGQASAEGMRKAVFERGFFDPLLLFPEGGERVGDAAPSEASAAVHALLDDWAATVSPRVPRHVLDDSQLSVRDPRPATRVPLPPPELNPSTARADASQAVPAAMAPDPPPHDHPTTAASGTVSGEERRPKLKPQRQGRQGIEPRSPDGYYTVFLPKGFFFSEGDGGQRAPNPAPAPAPVGVLEAPAQQTFAGPYHLAGGGLEHRSLGRNKVPAALAELCSVREFQRRGAARENGHSVGFGQLKQAARGPELRPAICQTEQALIEASGDAARAGEDDDGDEEEACISLSQKGLAVVIDNAYKRRLKPVPFSGPDLMRLQSFRAMALGIMPFLLQRRQFQVEEQVRTAAAAKEAAEKRRAQREASKAAALLRKEEKKRAAEARASAKGASRAAAQQKEGAKAGPRMKQLHWDVFAEDKLQGTIWDKAVEPPAEAKGHEELLSKASLDSIFHDLRDAMLIQQLKSQPDGGDKTKSKDQKPKQAMLIEGKRSQNICIMLAQFGRTSIDQVVEGIERMDIEAVGLAGVRAISQFVPEKTEIDNITRHLAGGADVASLGKAEKYLHAISKVSLLSQRLRILEVQSTFHAELEEARAAVTVLKKACNEVLLNPRLKTFFGIVLHIGNVINEGAAKGSAAGFRITSLMKLVQTKTNSGATLLEYIVEKVEGCAPELLQLQSDFPTAQNAGEKTLPIVKGDLNKLTKQSAFIENCLAMSKKRPEDPFQNVAGFAKDIAAKAAEALDEMTEVETKYHKTVQFLGEDPKKWDCDKFFGLLHDFASAIQTAIETVSRERRKKASNERKKAEKKFRDAQRAAKRVQLR